MEQVEELRKRANISYEEAKAILEETNGDLLEAIINLEKKNKIAPPSGGFYSTKNYKHDINSYSSNEENINDRYNYSSSISFSELLKKFFNLCKKILKKGNKNSFQVLKNGNVEMTIPVTILTIFVIFFFWITVPMIVVGLFFGYRYAFSGPDLGRENINSVIDSVANMADNLKKEIKGENSNGKDFNN